MGSSQRAWRVLISVVAIVCTLVSSAPWVPAVIVEAAEINPSADNTSDNTSASPAPVAQTEEEPPYIVYLPMILRNYTPPASQESTIKPGVGGTVGSPDGQVRIAFSTKAVTQTVTVRYTPTKAPSLPPDNLGVAGTAFILTAKAATTQDALTYFPYEVTTFTGVSPWYSVYTPSITISIAYTDADIWGLDQSVLSLYRKNDTTEEWEKIPTAVYSEQSLMVAEVDTIGTFVPMSRLAINASASSASSELTAQDDFHITDRARKLVLDPDDDEGHAYRDDIGYQREGTCQFTPDDVPPLYGQNVPLVYGQNVPHGGMTCHGKGTLTRTNSTQWVMSTGTSCSRRRRP